MLPAAVFLVAIALSACIEKHREDPYSSYNPTDKWCSQESYRGSECGIEIDQYNNLEIVKKNPEFYKYSDGSCPTYSTGYYCCEDPETAVHFEGHFPKLLDCKTQKCVYDPKMTADEAARKEKEYEFLGTKCVKVGQQPSNRIDCNGKNPTRAPTTLKPSFSAEPIKQYSSEKCSFEATLQIYFQLPEEASKKGGNCVATKDIAKNSISIGGNAQPSSKYRFDDLKKTLCDCTSGVLSEKDFKPYNCVLNGENIAKMLTECKAGGSVFDTLFGIFPEGGKLWLFFTVIAAVFVLVICLFCCCSCTRKN